MSEISDVAVARLLVSDYAAGGDSGKINILGAGLTVIGRDASTGLSSPFSVLATVSFDPRHAGETPAIELLLEDEAGAPVELPGPAGPLAQPQTMVVAQAHPIEEPQFPGLNVPRRTIRPTLQMVLNFGTGLPLAGGYYYTWRIKIDNSSSNAWTERIYVLATPPGIIFGGPMGSADLLPPST